MFHLPKIKRFRAFYRNAFDTSAHFLILARRAELDRLKLQPRFAEPGRLIRFGFKAFSQNEEDGIIHEIFKRIGVTNRYFIEFGVGDGLENNTLALIFQEWRGLWIEGNPENYQLIKNGLSRTIASGQLAVVHSFITRENIDGLIKGSCPHQEIDLLSIDLDGNDVHILTGISCVRPRVIVLEYNPKFPPPMQYCMEYDSKHSWDDSDCYGASLSFLEDRLHERGYSLVGCNLTGTNAFFVRNDLIKGHFAGPFTACYHYEPARYELVSVSSGHPPSYKTVETRVVSPIREEVAQ